MCHGARVANGACSLAQGRRPDCLSRSPSCACQAGRWPASAPGDCAPGPCSTPAASPGRGKFRAGGCVQDQTHQDRTNQDQTSTRAARTPGRPSTIAGAAAHGEPECRTDDVAHLRRRCASCVPPRRLPASSTVRHARPASDADRSLRRLTAAHVVHTDASRAACQARVRVEEISNHGLCMRRATHRVRVRRACRRAKRAAEFAETRQNC